MILHALYRLLTILVGPLIPRYLSRRLARGKEDPNRFGERLGRPGRPRPDGALVWLHAASVGESLSLLSLVDRLLERKLAVLMTTGTVTSAKLMAERLPAGAIHQFVPVDRPAYVAAFLAHWRPDLVLWAESDFWPNMLAAIQARHVPLVLVQGRISPRSYARWQMAKGFIRKVVGRFTLCLGQTSGDAERLTALGAQDARAVGNLKMAVPPLPCDDGELQHLKALIGDRPVWLAASTHAGEEVLVAMAHRMLADRFPRLLTIIVPRHPDRGAEVATEVKALGLAAGRRSAGDAPDKAIYIADTMGELGLFYRLAPVVFMGKSLSVEGGQNPFEPALLGAAVLFGPRMSNFPDMAPAMLAAGAAVEVAAPESLAHQVGRLLAEPTLLVSRRTAARTWAKAEAGALDGVMTALAPFIEQLHARP